jgi:hypothetical protein
MWHAWGRRAKCTRFWCERPKERDHAEDRYVDGRLLRFAGAGSGVDHVAQDRDR